MVKSMGYMETYKAWCENEYFDEATRAELKSIAGDEKESSPTIMSISSMNSSMLSQE